MQLLAQESSKQAVDEISMFLEGNGIPVHIGNAETARNFGFIAYAQKYDIWVIIDDQFSDAVALLEDETHEVENPVDVEEFYRTNSVDSSDVSSFIFNRVVLPGLGISIALFLFLLYVYNT